MEPNLNSREFTRVQAKVATKLSSEDAVQIVGTLENVSMNGVFLSCDSRLPVDTTCDISLYLEGGSEQILIRARGTVVRVETEGMALQFSEVYGRDSLEHLKNLVKYNSGSRINQIEQELGIHVGLKPAG